MATRSAGLFSALILAGGSGALLQEVTSTSTSGSMQKAEEEKGVIRSRGLYGRAQNFLVRESSLGPHFEKTLFTAWHHLLAR